MSEAEKKILDQPGIKEAREGQELLDEGKVEEARAKFAQAVALKPDLYVAWLMQGDIDQKAGKNDDAIMAAEKCLAIKPEFPQCLALMMNAAQAKGDKATYDKYAERYKAANPTDPTLYYNEAVGFLNKGDDAKAKPLLEKALEADPKYADAMFQLGMVYFRMGDTAKAKEMLQNFLATAPSHKEAPTARRCSSTCEAGSRREAARDESRARPFSFRASWGSCLVVGEIERSLFADLGDPVGPVHEHYTGAVMRDVLAVEVAVGDDDHQVADLCQVGRCAVEADLPAPGRPRDAVRGEPGAAGDVVDIDLLEGQ